MNDVLFKGFEPDPAPDENLSADRRLTLRQQAHVRAGGHPLTRGQLHPQASRAATRDDGPRLPMTCGTCVFRESHQWHNRTYPKCVAHGRIYLTHGTTTDVRAWWPACPNYLPTGGQS